MRRSWNARPDGSHRGSRASPRIGHNYAAAVLQAWAQDQDAGVAAGHFVAAMLHKKESEMRWKSLLVGVLIAGTLQIACAQMTRRRISPHETTQGTVDGAEISINYGRPSMRGRKI